jgi:hypothetical protein
LNFCSEEQATEEVAEPEEKQLTLDEWKALQERNRARASFNIRKAGEGVSAAPEWKKMFVLKKKVTEEHGEEEEEEEEEVSSCCSFFSQQSQKFEAIKVTVLF